MTDDWKMQISLKTQMGALINMRGNSTEEMQGQLAALNVLIPQILATEQQLTGAATVAAHLPLAPQQPTQQAPVAPPGFGGPQTPASGFPAQHQQVPMQQAYPAQSPVASPGAGEVKLCQHNLPAVWKEPGISKKTGQPYQGFWSCPLPREQQCRIPR